MSSDTKDALVFIGGMILCGGILVLIIKGIEKEAARTQFPDSEDAK